jgi:hypothetical protein
MLVLQKQAKYIEKAVQMPNGLWVLLVFELVEQNGKIIARAISGKVINQEISKEEALYLPSVKSPAEFIPVRSTIYSLQSTFDRDFSFVMSQPTRAPSF